MLDFTSALYLGLRHPTGSCCATASTSFSAGCPSRIVGPRNDTEARLSFLAQPGTAPWR